MKELENQQPSSCRTKRFPGLVLGIVQLIEEVDISKHRWKVKCLKCGRIFEVSNGTLTSYKNGTRTRCGGCPIERKSKYKIGDKYAGILIVNYLANGKFLLKCLNCGREFEASGATLLEYVNKKSEDYQFCSYCKPRKQINLKHVPGEVYGNCYELIKCLGGNLWLVKCIKCGKELEQSISNMKKHKKNICFYCEHPYSTKATFNRSKNSSMNIDERIYTYYKNKINRDNVQAKGKFKEFSLSLTDFSKLIHSDCAYCGAKPTSNNVWNKSGKRISDESLVYINGIDRINSDLGYTISNCVSCCPICNRMKLDLSVNEFYNHVEQIYKKRLNDQSKDVEASASKQESSL